MTKYAARIIAAMYALGWFVWATSLIGSPSTGKPASWEGAALFGLVVAFGVIVGMAAGLEQSEDDI